MEAFDKYALKYQEVHMNIERYKASIDIFCENIENESGRILDVCCGPGNITKYLLEKRPNFKILGIDLAPRMVALAEENNPQAEFQIMNCKSISELDKQFDGIMCGFCFPYLSKKEALKFISDASNILSSNGAIYISTIEGDYNKSGFVTSSESKEDKIFMHYYQANFLINRLKECGFTNAEFNKIEYIDRHGALVKELAINARK